MRAPAGLPRAMPEELAPGTAPLEPEPRFASLCCRLLFFWLHHLERNGDDGNVRKGEGHQAERQWQRRPEGGGSCVANWAESAGWVAWVVGWTVACLARRS